MPSAASRRAKRLRYPENREAAARAAVSPIEEQRGVYRPNKLDNPEVRGLLLGAAAFATVEIAASMAGVAPSSVYDLRKRDPEFEERWQAARARAIASVEMALYTNAVAKMSVEAQKFFLASHRPDLYRQRTEVEVSTTVAEELAVVGERARLRKLARLAATEVVTAEIVKVEPGGNGHGDHGHLPDG